MSSESAAQDRGRTYRSDDRAGPSLDSAPEFRYRLSWWRWLLWLVELRRAYVGDFYVR